MSVLRRSDVAVESWETEEGLGLLVYDGVTGGGHVLNPATAAVFELCDGRASRDEMAESMAQSTGLPLDVDIVDLALMELGEAGLLTAPLTSDSLSRRAVISRLALGAAAVALLPAVLSVAGVGQAAEATTRTSAEPVPIMPDDKSASTTEATPVDVTLTSVGGYTGADVLFWIATDPGHGTVTVAGTTATYTPASGFIGTDTFRYLVGQCITFVDVGAGTQSGRTNQAAGVAPTCSSTGTLVSSEDEATVTIVVNASATTTTTEPATTTTTAPTTAKPATATVAQPTYTG